MFTQAFYSPEVINLVGGLTSEFAKVNIEQGASIGRGMEKWSGSNKDLLAIRNTSRTALIPLTNSILGDLKVGQNSILLYKVKHLLII